MISHLPPPPPHLCIIVLLLGASSFYVIIQDSEIMIILLSQPITAPFSLSLRKKNKENGCEYIYFSRIYCFDDERNAFCGVDNGDDGN